MSDKQWFPLSSTLEGLRQPIEHWWGSAPAEPTEMDLRDMQFLRSWVVYDSAIEIPPRRLNWNAVLGLSLATAVSASIWAGIGLIIANLWN